MSHPIDVPITCPYCSAISTYCLSPDLPAPADLPCLALNTTCTQILPVEVVARALADQVQHS